MNIIEEFFIKFSSNAKDLKKEYDSAERATKDFQEAVNKTDNRVAQLGLTFSKVALAGISALTGAKLYEDLKRATVQAADYNFQLHRTAALTGVNARELSIWDGAVQAAGGSAGEFLGYIQSLNSQYAALGVNDRIQYVTRDFLTLAKAWEGLSQAQKQQRATLLGLTPGEILLLDQGYDRVQQILRAQEMFNNQNDKTAAQGNNINEILSNTDKQWKAIGTDLMPIYEFWVKLKLAFADGLRIVILLAEAMGRLAILQPGHAWKDLKEAWTTFWEGGEYLGGTGPYAKGAKASGSGAAPVTINPPAVNGALPLGIRSNNPGNLQPGGKEAVFGSLADGVAAEEAQLGKYGRKGVNTLAGIAARWPDQANAATWLKTVSQYSGIAPNQAIDLNDPAIQAKIANAINVAENGAAFSNLVGAANSNLGQANSSGLNAPIASGGNSLTTGPITIHTQATDAKGIATDFHGAMQKEYAQTIGSTDDGVMY